MTSFAKTLAKNPDVIAAVRELEAAVQAPTKKVATINIKAGRESLHELLEKTCNRAEKGEFVAVCFLVRFVEICKELVKGKK